MNNKVVLINTGTRGAVDIDLPGTGREHEMLVTRKKASEVGVGDEVVKQIVKVKRPHSVTLNVGDRKVFDSKILDDPVTASRIRSGVLGVAPYERVKTKSVTASTFGTKSTIGKKKSNSAGKE